MKITKSQLRQMIQEAVLKEQVSPREEDYEYAANRLVAAVESFKKTAYRDSDLIGKGSMARMKLDEDSLHEAFLSLKTIMNEVDGVRDAIMAANIDDEF